MIIYKAFRFRLYPTLAQQAALEVQFGHARYVYNWGLATRQAYYRANGKGLSHNALKKQLTVLKHQPGHEWLQAADSQVLQAKLEDLNEAYQNFFAGRAKYPRFKSKKNEQKIRYPQRFRLNSSRILLPKVGWVKVTVHRKLEGTPKHITVSKTKSGEYYGSIQCVVEIPTPQRDAEPAVGIDLGLTHFATLSTGEKIEHPHCLRQSEKKLARAQRRLSRKQPGSRSYARASRKVARLNEHIAHQRRDFLDRLSHRLVREFGTIRLENLNVRGMMHNHCLAKAIADSGWTLFVELVKYKGQWAGCQVEQVDRFFASTQRCSICSYQNVHLTLKDRFWVCPECHTLHDRDTNAAINIRDFKARKPD